MLAFYGGVCDATLCGVVDMAMHPDQAAVGLVVAAANGLSPGLVDLIAPDYSIRAQATAFAARVHSSDPAESARAQGQVAGMVLALLLPFKALRGGGVDPLLARSAPGRSLGAAWSGDYATLEDAISRGAKTRTGASGWNDIVRRLKDYHGVEPEMARVRIHAIKQAYGIPADQDLTFGLTGDVWDPVSGEYLGTLTGKGWSR